MKTEIGFKRKREMRNSPQKPIQKGLILGKKLLEKRTLN